jgi:hypothetical protein
MAQAMHAIGEICASFATPAGKVIAALQVD